MRRASPNPLPEQSVIVALRKALKFTAGPNPQRMAGGRLTVSAPRTNCFTQHFHARAKAQNCSLAVGPDEATRKSHLRPPRAPCCEQKPCLTWKQVSLLVNFSISPGKQDRRRFAL